MKRAKLGLAALTVIVAGAAAVAFKPAPKAGRFTAQFFEYGGTSGTAAQYNNANNYQLLSGGLSCTSGQTMCQIFATPTTVNGQLPQLPAGFGTAVAAYDVNGTKTVSPTKIDGITIDFLVP